MSLVMKKSTCIQIFDIIILTSIPFQSIGLGPVWKWTAYHALAWHTIPVASVGSEPGPWCTPLHGLSSLRILALVLRDRVPFLRFVDGGALILLLHVPVYQYGVIQGFGDVGDLWSYLSQQDAEENEFIRSRLVEIECEILFLQVPLIIMPTTS